MKLILSLLLLITLPTLAQRDRIDNAPKVGDPIPKTSAIRLSDQKKIDLSSPEKITVLILGSHT